MLFASFAVLLLFSHASFRIRNSQKRSPIHHKKLSFLQWGGEILLSLAKINSRRLALSLSLRRLDWKPTNLSFSAMGRGDSTFSGKGNSQQLALSLSLRRLDWRPTKLSFLQRGGEILLSLAKARASGSLAFAFPETPRWATNKKLSFSATAKRGFLDFLGILPFPTNFF